PFVARDAASALPAPRGPRWLVAPWTRALVSGGACIAIGVAEWGRPDLPLGIGLDRALVPAGAADFMAAHGIRGRTFNHFHLGGYLAYRGWPDRDRLPFVTTQPENIRPEIREAYPRVFVDAEAWRALDRRYRFDIAILDRDQDPGDRLLDFLDADSSWALVFAGVVALQQSRPRDALREFERERSLHGEPAGIDARIGQAHEALGDVGAARRSYALELRRHPEDQEAKAGQLRLTPK